MNFGRRDGAVIIVFLCLLQALLLCAQATAAQLSPKIPDADDERRSVMELAGSPENKKNSAVPSAPERLQPSVFAPALLPEMRGSIRSVKVTDGRKVVALTFDLCERERKVSGYDSEVVDFLRANKIRATFFASGRWMRSHPEKTMQLMSDPLFEVGNHGWSHRNLRLLDRKRAEEEILYAQAQYELIWEEMQKESCLTPGANNSAHVPRVPGVFRFPFGTCNREALNFLNSIGLAAIQWDVVTGDASMGQTASRIAEIVRKKARPGSIIILHANGRGHGTAGALPIFIPEMQKSGFVFVTVSELLGSGTPVTASDCYELRPNDNLRYDKMFR